MSDTQQALTLQRSKTGSLVIHSNLTWPELEALAERLSAEDGRSARISSRHVVWAGPYELYLAVQPLIDTASGLVGAGAGLAALVIELVRAKPEQPIHIHIDNSRTIVVDGSRDLTAEETAAINDLASEYGKDPNDEDWEATEPGQ